MTPTIFIGIDPDLKKSGVAVWNRKTKHLDLSLKTFPELLDLIWDEYIEATCKGENAIQVHVEAGWLNSKSNYHPAQGAARREKIAKNVGENHATGKLIVEWCRYHGIEVVERKPMGKVNAEYFHRLTGIATSKTTGQEFRDAGMLVFQL